MTCFKAKNTLISVGNRVNELFHLSETDKKINNPKDNLINDCDPKNGDPKNDDSLKNENALMNGNFKTFINYL